MVVEALITAKAKKLKLSFEQNSEFDLKDKGVELTPHSPPLEHLLDLLWPLFQR